MYYIYLFIFFILSQKYVFILLIKSYAKFKTNPFSLTCYSGSLKFSLIFIYQKAKLKFPQKPIYFLVKLTILNLQPLNTKF